LELVRRIATAVLFLASDERFVTGVTLPVDGGSCLKYQAVQAGPDRSPSGLRFVRRRNWWAQRSELGSFSED
jgi:hypothetical protein